MLNISVSEGCSISNSKIEIKIPFFLSGFKVEKNNFNFCYFNNERTKTIQMDE